MAADPTTAKAPQKRIRLGLSIRGIGYHRSAWLHPSIQPDGPTDFSHFKRVAELAERGLFDFLFLADQCAVIAQNTPAGAFGRAHDGVAELEPITLLAALSQATSHIGLIATASTTFHKPYHLARQFASIDKMSGGRAGWNIVTSSRDEEAKNFGMDAIPDKKERYAIAAETLNAVTSLWKSWDIDAFTFDRKTGYYFDPNKMRPTVFKGNHLSVNGILTLPRSPQHRPLLVQAGSSSDGMSFAAATADVIYTAQTSLQDAQNFYGQIKARVSEHGRDPTQVLVMPGLMPVVGHTREKAYAKYKHLKALVDPLSAMEAMSRFYGDLSDYDLDGPVPPLKDDAAKVSRAQLTDAAVRTEGWTIRRLLETTALGHSHPIVVGSPADIADHMEYWVENVAADGFNILPALSPIDVAAFVELVVPELQRRGRHREFYPGGSLRSTLGLLPLS